MTKNKSPLRELWDFLKIRKAWWLAPIIITLIIVGVFIILAQSGVISPDVYALI